jgi:hypothetical protein
MSCTLHWVVVVEVVDSTLVEVVALAVSKPMTLHSVVHPRLIYSII